MTLFAVLTAIPQEHAPLRRKAGLRRAGPPGRPRVFRAASGDAAHLLVETGMGTGGLASALDAAMREGPLSGVVSAGFAGALSPHLRVGDVVLCARAGLFQGNAPPRWYALPPSPSLLRFAHGHGAREGSILTADTPRAKHALARQRGGETAVLDMETASLAALCHARGLPMLALRAVSDALTDAVAFDLALVSDRNGHVRPLRAARAVIRNPRLAPHFYGLWRRSRTAAESLARVLSALMALPPAECSALFSLVIPE